MLADAPCPVCGNGRWEKLRSQTFARPGGDADRYLRTRIDVFLDVWNSGGDQGSVTWNICSDCGFVAYLPRPTASDVAAKYQALSTGRLSSATRRPAEGYDPAKWDEGDATGAHRRRAAALFDLLRDWIAPGSAILDFGGGSGRLMRDFVAAGHRCSVLDYGIRKPLPGVAYAGATFDDLEAGSKYDVIICSHVLEHVADPVGDLRKLLALLAGNGLLYVEVPCELWRGGPAPREPVTHINYFSAGPVHTMIERAGGYVHGCHYAPFITYDGKPSLAVKALAGTGDGVARETFLAGPDAARALMTGSLRPLLHDWQPGRFAEPKASR